MGYLGTLALLGLLILIHEAGHLAAAKLVGIPVAEFSVGFGPKVWSRRRGRTEYAVRMLPLGGYVLPAVTDPEEFRAFALRRRLVYFLGGPLANLLAALPLSALLNGFRSGFSLDAILLAPFTQVAGACWQLVGTLPSLVTGSAPLTGIVGIVRYGSRAVAEGQSLPLALLLSVSLAVLNLLPIPVLDGGQILMAALEELFPRLVRLRVPLTVMGIVLLASVMIYTNVHDVFSWLA